MESFEKDSAGVKETVKNFFRVEDMFMFDNLGFTNTVNTTKFLSCADCDLGPIGFHDLNTRIRNEEISKFTHFTIEYFHCFKTMIMIKLAKLPHVFQLCCSFKSCLPVMKTKTKYNIKVVIKNSFNQ